MVMFWLLALISLAYGTAVALYARDRGPWLLQAAFASIVIVSTYTASKIGLAFEGTYISVAVALYSATFLLTDTLGELWGKKMALRAVLAGFAGQVIMIATNLIVLAAPAAPFWGHQEAFDVVLGITPRLALASVVAYAAAQTCDVFVFDKLKRLFRGRWLFLRNNGSTAISQSVDSCIFFGIGFWGLVPDLGELITTAIFIKLLIALLDTPFLYLIRWYYTRGIAASTSSQPNTSSPVLPRQR